MSSGIRAAQTGKTIDDRPLAYSSENGHLLVDAREELNRLTIYEGSCGPAVLNVVATTIGVEVGKEQEFHSVRHGLGYVPRVQVNMLIRDAPAALAYTVGQYAGGYIPMPGTPASEKVFVRVTENYLYLMHQAQTSDLTPYNSILQNMRIRAKIMINSNEVAGEPYDIPFQSID